ncbi:CDP-glycerol glycerophosphotransferase family protein, partial [Escherichia marmotae]|nr:CDP-glycerol glycerophosphotransferase family protein [Escherichia marmotae]
MTQSKKESTSISSEANNIITENIKLFTKISHLIHTGEGVNCAYQIDMWVDVFMSSGEPFAILTRNIELYQWAIRKYPYLNITYARRPVDVDTVLNNLPWLYAIYYTSNTGNLIHTLKHNKFKHIFLGHGDSDKAASAHKFFRVYDEIWVAGQAHIDRFKKANLEIRHLQFIKVGRPNLKKIIKDAMREFSCKNESKNNTIVYLPTWEGVYEENNYSSARLSPVFLSKISQKTNSKIVAKFHPLTGTRDRSMSQLYTALNDAFVDCPYMLTVTDSSYSIPKLVMEGDFFICDISAVVSECISSLRPIFVYVPRDRNITMSSSSLNYEDYTYTFSTIEQLIELIDDVIINGKDYLKEARFQA